MMADKYGAKSNELTQKIQQIEWLEEDVQALKNKHEEAVQSLQAEFHALSRDIDSLLSGTSGNYDELQKNQESDHLMDRYVQQHLEEVAENTAALRRQLDADREGGLTERNGLSWE